MDKEILIIDRESTRPISTEDIVMPGGNGQHGPVVRIEKAHEKYLVGLRALKLRVGKWTTLFEEGVLDLGRERRERILRVIAEVRPGARDKFLGEDGLVVETTGRVSRERRRVA